MGYQHDRTFYTQQKEGKRKIVDIILTVGNFNFKCSLVLRQRNFTIELSWLYTDDTDIDTGSVKYVLLKIPTFNDAKGIKRENVFMFSA